MSTRKEQVLRHLAGMGSGPYRYVMPYGSTQDGIADDVGISRAHASIVLKQLEDEMMVYHEKSLIHGSRSRRNSYRLMPLGWMVVKDLIECEEAM